MSKPSLARGTRDFGPEIMIKRNFIFDVIKEVYQKFGFQPLETPAFENLSVLMGKYGDEGDQLMFKILNSGEFSQNLTPEDLQKSSKDILKKVSEKGLKYDLTVPFARYVVMNRHNLPIPFKRYQIQPVWRADRPQKGRYREFYQCDADVVGTESLFCEAEIVAMLHEIFEKLGLNDFVIKINNRKVLTGITEVIGAAGKEVDLCVAIDKLDKIGREKVEEELLSKGFSTESIKNLDVLFNINSVDTNTFEKLTTWLSSSQVGVQGVNELKEIWELVAKLGLDNPKIEFDPSLARGLGYYTGAIFEVKAINVSIGSISGGGRYDNLTGTFGMPGLSGVGISLGVDRIYDVMEELSIFPETILSANTKVLICNFGGETQLQCLKYLTHFRSLNINAEMFPDELKIKKQFDYANKKNIPFVIIIGSDEAAQNKLTIKDMNSGEQETTTIDKIIEKINV